ncbi:hypothetical protein HDV05_002733 [Chytridiales sp. JEL 0842]|nr:hypothetical protein HDV05_002733 [Chytridiales sp. JEL 0842]
MIKDQHKAEEKQELDLEGDGVTKVSNLRSQWTKSQSYTVLSGLVLLGFAMSFDGLLLNAMSPAILNTFSKVSIIALLPLILNLLSLLAIPVFTRFSDVVGRGEAIAVALGLYIVGYIIQATSPTLSQLAGGQVIYSLGFSGASTLSQVLVAGM